MGEELRTLVPGLHVFEARAPNAMGRRMTVMDLGGGKLAIHNVIDLDVPSQLDALGEVALILVPNAMHTIEAPELAARYPKARVLAPRALMGKLAKRGRVDGALEDWPAELEPQLACVPLGGNRMHECVFLHRATRTLVVADLAFHFLDEDFTGFKRTAMRWNRAIGPLGPSRVFTGLAVTDRAALGASLRKLLELDFDRVVMAHGRVVDSGAREALRSGFASFLA